MNRLSWRLGWRSLWQRTSLTLLMMITLAAAVAAVTVTASVHATSRFGPDELGPMFTGNADYIVRTDEGIDATSADAAPVVGSRGTIVPDRDLTSAEVTTESGKSLQTIGRILDLANPLTEGLYTVTDGSPGNEGIALSTALATGPASPCCNSS